MKISELKRCMQKKNLNLVILLNSEPKNKNFNYIANSQVLGILIVSQKKDSVLYVPPPEYHIAKSDLKKSTEKIKIMNSRHSALKIIKSEFRKQIKGRVGLDYSTLTHIQFKLIKKELGIKQTVDISKDIAAFRAIKTKSEIISISKAINATEKILLSIIKDISKFHRECEVSSEFMKRAGDLGLEMAFDPMVASGKNSSKWHHTPSRSPLSRGFLLFDVGLRYNGYCADITRTIFIGKPTKKEINAYEKVLTVQNECIEMVKPNTKFLDIHNHAAKKLGANFPYAIGHGFGLEAHEPLIGKTTNVLEPGMILTIEPGLHYPGKYGLRIEDDLLITKTGCRKLTTLSRNLQLIRR